MTTTSIHYATIYRCAECGWSTQQYAEIDAHEDQLDPGHFVVGRVEELSRRTSDN